MEIENDLIKLQVEKEITSLFKSYLEILSQIEIDNKIMLGKIDQHTTEGFSDNINYLTKEKHDLLRKLVLDKGNDSIRNLSTFLGYFDFQINPQKLQEASQKTKIVKKICVNSYITDTI
jgi:hypothetical protein